MLVDRCLKLSHPKFHKANFALIKTTLLDNNYPEVFINKLINLRIKMLEARAITQIAATPTSEAPDIKRTLVLPYVEGLTQNLRRIIKKFGLGVISNNGHKLSNYLKTSKDPITWDKKSNVVYSIPCEMCAGTYVGQTKRYLKIRINEHEKGVLNSAKVDPSKYTALTQHSVDFKHLFNYNKVKILGTEPHPYKRNLLEMIHITREEHAINFRTDVKGLSSVYRSLLS